MEEISRQLKTQASIELLNVDSLQKQYDYRLLIVSSSEKQLMDIIQNVSLILRQLAGMDRSDGKLSLYKSTTTPPPLLLKYLNNRILPKGFDIRYSNSIMHPVTTYCSTRIEIWCHW